MRLVNHYAELKVSRRGADVTPARCLFVFPQQDPGRKVDTRRAPTFDQQGADVGLVEEHQDRLRRAPGLLAESTRTVGGRSIPTLVAGVLSYAAARRGGILGMIDTGRRARRLSTMVNAGR
ncbi:hypothetical protein [Micromonospora polyrhachis]|uniref:Uncharacterized protein n=1 Tax=Micromonospora polyrhachis TaxID=1282883 RepID=A0A7W7WPP5_9ACTN|nr:hypothetical protein [Micromonospora polyrhachis]MBB4958757.1 hypothetical protein [Micromonospora polyrhachis]